MAPQAAAIYARISSDPDGTRLGVTRQVQDCRAFARRRGWRVADVYVDDDVSAYSGKRRPEYSRMLEDLAAQRIDAVVVYHLDRLHRRPRELEDFLDACARAGVRDMACVTGEIDLATHDGQFHARILGAVARKESDDKSRRLQRKHLEIAHAGRISGGGFRPYGYAADRVTVVPEEAAVIREMAQRFLAGDSLCGIADDLQARGIPTVTGSPWTVGVVRRILVSGRIGGQREHRGELMGKAVWPAIVRPRQAARLRAILTAPERRLTRVARRYLLASLLRCDSCGQRMLSKPRMDGRRRYVCVRDPRRGSCGGTAIMAEPVEAVVTAAVFERMTESRLRAAFAKSGTDDEKSAQALATMEEAQRRLDSLAEAYGQGKISLREWQAARAPLLQRLGKVKGVLQQQTQTTALEAVIGKNGGVASAFEALPLARQQAVIAAVLDCARIKPAVRRGNRFDPDRVLPAWRI